MVAVAVAVDVVDGLFDSEQPTSASMIVTTRSGVARRIARMLATADRSTVASTRLWLKVFTSRRVRETVCDPGLAACSDCLVSGRVTSLLPRRAHHPILSVCERRRGSLKLATGTRFDDARVATETGLGVIMDPRRFRVCGPRPGRTDEGEPGCEDRRDVLVRHNPNRQVLARWRCPAPRSWAACCARGPDG